MTKLIVMLSSGKGTWGSVNSLIKVAKWETVYLICNEFSHENFEVNSQNIIKLKIDEKNPIKDVDKLSNFFKKEIKDMEVAVNFVSGSGLEHMALVSSILKAGLGIRFVYSDYNELKEIELMDLPYEEDEDEF